MRYDTISAIGDFTALTAASTDYLRLDPGRCVGGDDPPLRTRIQPKPGAHGAFVYPPLDDAQIITLAGVVVIESGSSDGDYLDSVEDLYQDLKAALDAMRAAPDDLVHADGSLSVWKYAPAEKSWDATVCSITFSVVVDG